MLFWVNWTPWDSQHYQGTSERWPVSSQMLRLCPHYTRITHINSMILTFLSLTSTNKTFHSCYQRGLGSTFSAIQWLLRSRQLNQAQFSNLYGTYPRFHYIEYIFVTQSKSWKKSWLPKKYLQTDILYSVNDLIKTVPQFLIYENAITIVQSITEHALNGNALCTIDDCKFIGCIILLE